jgi:hypothetical protein
VYQDAQNQSAPPTPAAPITPGAGGSSSKTSAEVTKADTTAATTTNSTTNTSGYINAEVVEAEMAQLKKEPKAWQLSIYDKARFDAIGVRLTPKDAMPPELRVDWQQYNRSQDVQSNPETRVQLLAGAPHPKHTYIHANFVAGTLLICDQKFALEDAIGSHAFAPFEALPCV